LLVSCGYLQVNPPPDVKAPDETLGKSAWLAAAANTLAAAGYGYGQDVQVKAEKIYLNLTDHYGENQDGWTDAAIQWWIGSDHNEWPENPYKLVTVIGNKRPPLPWKDPQGSLKIANMLRDGNFILASISWPGPDGSGTIRGGHVLNCWGDDRGEKKNSRLAPEHLRVTDSYRNKGGILQTYKYYDFERISPDGNGIVQGWFISYDEHLPFIKHIIILSKVSNPPAGNKALLSRIMMDIKNEMKESVSEISCEVLVDSPLLSFQSAILSNPDKIIRGKDIYFQGNQTVYLCEWALDRKEVGSGAALVASFESVGEMGAWAGIKNGYMKDRQGEETIDIPAFSYRIETKPVGIRYQASNATGGYLLFSLTFIRSDTLFTDSAKTIETYILKQYPADINPEQPILYVTAQEGLGLKSINAGHSYGYLDPHEQKQFISWMTKTEINHIFSGDTLAIPVNMIGLLPFPEGENYAKRALP
jgi:hypothetical protein